jgi:hypothetical protein
MGRNARVVWMPKTGATLITVWRYRARLRCDWRKEKAVSPVKADAKGEYSCKTILFRKQHPAF